MLLAGLFAASMATSASAFDVIVTIKNVAPDKGTFLTPVWVGFHNGAFDLFNDGAAASPALERIAEDGTTGPLSGAFGMSGFGSIDGTILSSGPIPPFAPGETASMRFTLDPMAATSRYFSYASMVIPSNDAFIANANPMQFSIFDGSGNFLGANFTVRGSMARDAGTERNDEIPMNTAFFGQMMPDTGIVEAGVIGLHPGFNAGGAILSDARFANADFTRQGYNFVEISVTAAPDQAAVPEVSTSVSAAAFLGLIGLGIFRRSRKVQAA